MGAVMTIFVYNDIEDALYYSSYYADILTIYKNDYNSKIYSDGENWILEFTVYGTRRGKNKPGNSEGIRCFPKSNPENS